MKKRIVCLILAAILLTLSGCGAQSAASAAASSTGRAQAGGDASAGASADDSSALPAGGELQVYCFQAGAADAILLTTDSSAVLIDTGESGFGKEIVSYLETKGVTALDGLILTHFDQDHVGGAAKVLSSVPVRAVYQSDCPKDSAEYKKYEAALEKAGLTAVTVRQSTAFLLDGVSYAIDPPRQTDYSESPSNNSSLIISAKYGARRFLFAGDAQDARLAEFLSEAPGTCDFLKVPYHGRWLSSLSAFFSAVRPAYAVITSSEEEPESTQTLNLLKSVGAETFLTRTAPVLAVCDGTSLTVSYDEAGQ